jgi:hypothetical protein
MYDANLISGVLARMSILVQMSIRNSSFGFKSRFLMGNENSVSQTRNTAGRGKVCISKGAIQRLIQYISIRKS